MSLAETLDCSSKNIRPQLSAELHSGFYSLIESIIGERDVPTRLAPLRILFWFGVVGIGRRIYLIRDLVGCFVVDRVFVVG